MKAKNELLRDIAMGIYGIRDAHDALVKAIEQLKPVEHQTVVEFNKVIWLDSTGEHILIWYADGTGQVLTVEGQIHTISTVGHNGRTCYKLTNGRELFFPRHESKMVINHG